MYPVFVFCETKLIVIVVFFQSFLNALVFWETGNGFRLYLIGGSQLISIICSIGDIHLSSTATQLLVPRTDHRGLL